VAPEALADDGAAAFDLTVDDSDALKGAVADCGDLIAFIVEQEEASEAEAACAEEHFSNEVAAALLVGSFLGEAPDAEAQQASTDFDACLGDD
jgi:hypothetical protein